MDDCPAKLPFDGISEWVPISFLPEGDYQVLASALPTDDHPEGRVMIWNTKLLRQAMSDDAPEHLRFPAIAWRQVPRVCPRGGFSLRWLQELQSRRINTKERI
jgi:hypothetical protein